MVNYDNESIIAIMKCNERPVSGVGIKTKDYGYVMFNYKLGEPVWYDQNNKPRRVAPNGELR